MKTYSELKKVPIPQEYVVNEENIKDTPCPHPDNPEYQEWKSSLSLILNAKHKRGANHNYTYISAKECREMPSASCTGSLFYKNTYDQNKPNLDTPAILVSNPYSYNSDHQEYLNFLLNPNTSPYKFLMDPKNYKIVVDDKNNIIRYAFLDNETPAPWIGSLMILERVWAQHGANNRFWEYWKEQDKLSFEAFFLFQHSAYLGQSDQRTGWNLPQVPYSTFDMIFINTHYPYMSRTPFKARFSAPRLFQHKPNTKAYETLLPKGFLKTYTVKGLNGHPQDNLLWSGEYEKDDDVSLTVKYEHAVYNFARINVPQVDRYGKVLKGSTNGGFVIENFYKENESMTKDNCVSYHNAMRAEIHKIIEEYSPQFYQAEVA